MSEIHSELRVVYNALLASWNARDAAAFASCFADDGMMIGFDASLAEGRPAIEAHLSPIFRDHPTAAFVAIVRRVWGDNEFGLLHADAGMVPPGKTQINSATNTRHVIALRHVGDGSQIVLFQNTPIRLDRDEPGRKAIEAELQAAYQRGGVVH